MNQVGLAFVHSVGEDMAWPWRPGIGPTLDLGSRVSAAMSGPRFLPQHQGRLMDTTYNGMPAAELGDVRWLKSQYSNATGECVELAALPNGLLSTYPIASLRVRAGIMARTTGCHWAC